MLLEWKKDKSGQLKRKINLYLRYQLEATEKVTNIAGLGQPYAQHFPKLASAYVKVHPSYS